MQDNIHTSTILSAVSFATSCGAALVTCEAMWGAALDEGFEAEDDGAILNDDDDVDDDGIAGGSEARPGAAGGGGEEEDDDGIAGGSEAGPGAAGGGGGGMGVDPKSGKGCINVGPSTWKRTSTTVPRPLNPSSLSL